MSHRDITTYESLMTVEGHVGEMLRESKRGVVIAMNHTY